METSVQGRRHMYYMKKVSVCLVEGNFDRRERVQKVVNYIAMGQIVTYARLLC